MRSLIRGLLFIASLHTYTIHADPTKEELAKAESFFVEAEKYYRAGSYEKALSLYTESYVITTNPAFLFNIAQCQVNLKKFEEAIKSYKKYLQDASANDEMLLDNIDGILLALKRTSDLTSDSSFPTDKKSKKSAQEVIDLANSLLKKYDGLPKPSYLAFQGPEGAEVFVDGSRLGQLPLESTKIKTGSHKIVAKKDGFVDSTFEVSVISGETKKVTVDLTPHILQIDGPSGATVLIDGQPKGSLPAKVEGLKSGEHEVKVTADGYLDWSQSIRFPSEKNPQLLSVALTPILLKIDGPTDTELFFDGSSKGMLPVVIEAPSKGEHQLLAKKPGAPDWSKTIKLAGDKAEVTLRVEAGKQARDDQKGGPGGTPFYVGAGVLAAGGVGALAGAFVNLSQMKKLSELNDPGVTDLIDAGAKKTIALEVTAGALLATSVVMGVVGVVVQSSKKKETQAKLLVTPMGAMLSGGF